MRIQEFVPGLVSASSLYLLLFCTGFLRVDLFNQKRRPPIAMISAQALHSFFVPFGPFLI